MTQLDAIHKGQLLEDEFFHVLDQELRAKLRESMEREEAKQQLSAATGFQDPELLEHLVDSGFEVATLAALALAPAVLVAWADGWVSPTERKAVLNAAIERGFKNQPIALELIKAWLKKRPAPSLGRVWKAYAQAVQNSIPPSLSSVLMREIERQATIVAQASGWTFGLGKVSKQERAVLDEIASLLNQQD